MDLPISKTLTIYRGDPFSYPFRLRIDGEFVDLAGWTGAAQLRRFADSKHVVADFDVTFELDVDPAAWRCTVSLEAAVTRLLTLDGVWDLKLTAPTEAPVTWMAGPVILVKDVTRP